MSNQLLTINIDQLRKFIKPCIPRSKHCSDSEVDETRDLKSLGDNRGVISIKNIPDNYYQGRTSYAPITL